MDYFDDVVKPPLTPYHDANECGGLKPYQVEWLGDGMPPAATEVEWPEVGLDGEGQWARLSALDWLAAYHGDPYWREAGIMGLVRLAHTIASRRNHHRAWEGRGDAGGADMFSDGLLAITRDIDKDLAPKVWGLRIARGIDRGQRRRRHRTPEPEPVIFTVDWRAIERLSADELDSDVRAACIRGITDTREPWRKLEAKEASEILESCLADPRTRYVIARKADEWSEREIAAELGVKVGVVKRIVKKTYLEACDRLGVEPTKRKTRTGGRRKMKRPPAADAAA